MLENIQNVLNVPEFRKRAVFTLIMFIVFRLGVHIPVPGVDSSVIENLFSSGNLFGLLDLFAGGALSKFSVLAMSITPYINASIIMQLLTAVVPICTILAPQRICSKASRPVKTPPVPTI